MSGPALSIVMPVHDGARFLPEQLDSILSQSFADFELIAVDDDSSDGSLAVLTEYARRDARLRLFRNESNLGQKSTLTKYLPLARANWIALSDQDDVWLPHKLAKLFAILPSHAAAYCDSELIDEHGTSLGMGLLDAILFTVPASGCDPFMLWERNCVSGHAMIFRRDLVGRFLPFTSSLPYDQQIAITALAHGGLSYCPERLVRHRLHGANACNRDLLAKRAAALGKRLDPQSPRNRGERIARRQKFRRSLRDKLDYFSAKGLLPRQWLPVADTGRFESRLFDLPLFWFLLSKPMFIGDPPLPRRLKRAYKYAKGARWYAAAETWTRRLARLRGS